MDKIELGTGAVGVALGTAGVGLGANSLDQALKEQRQQEQATTA
ncbi:hypothetical protein [Streptomyces sp. NPDC056464]